MKSYFNINSLKSSFFTALFLSLPIYLSHYGISSFLLNTLIVLYALYRFVHTPKRDFFSLGFFIGLLWFWWIGLSFRYQGFEVSVYVVPFLIAFIYASIFWLIAKLSYKPLILIAFIFGWDYITPFNFDWFKLDLLLSETYFGVDKLSFFLIVFGLYFSRYFRLAPFLLFLYPLFTYVPVSHTIPDSFKLVTTYIPQEKKWKEEEILPQVTENLKEIDQAIKEKKKVILFPESAFPLLLNSEEELLQLLKQKSYSISIVLGSLKYSQSRFYNSTYVFDQGEMSILDKHVLVPFGEYVPLPKFMRDTINQTFFHGGEDYVTADSYSDYHASNRRFTNAICYEATTESLYQSATNTIIALSNNGWFIPSIEPTLQRLLITLYAKRYRKNVYHVINGSPSFSIIVNNNASSKK